MSAWSQLAEGLRDSGIEFLLPPEIRFRGEPREQATMYLRDPSGNAMEFKAFADDAMVFLR
jgi:extradiol dioxygenase family protein